MTLAVVPYDVQIDHDGRKHRVTIPDLSVPRCSVCGEISIDRAAEQVIDTAFRRTAGLLTPEEIYQRRLECRLTQQQLADRLAIASATISRWENGNQVQQRCQDLVLRAFFEVPAFREYVTARLGTAAVTDFEVPTVATNTSMGKIEVGVPDNRYQPVP